MIIVDDIQAYLIHIGLMGQYPFYAQRRDGTSVGLVEFVKIDEDIQYTSLCDNIVIPFTVKKGDYLNISNKTNILPIKAVDFDREYVRSEVQKHAPLDIDF